jgi:hypothetical protein
MPPAVSAAVTIKAANFGSRQPPPSMKATVVLNSRAFRRPAWIIVAPTPIRSTSRPASANEVVVGVLNSVVAMSGSLCGCEKAVNGPLVNTTPCRAVVT